MFNRCTPASVPVNSLGRRGRRGNGSTLDRDRAACALRWEGRRGTELDETLAVVLSAHHCVCTQFHPAEITPCLLITMGFGRCSATLVIAIGAERGLNSLLTITPWLLPRTAGRAGRTTCLSSYRYWASRSLQQASL